MGDFEPLRGHKYAVVVTFRRNGEAVPSPVWFGVAQNGCVYVKTRHAGKVKRLRNDNSLARRLPSSAGVTGA